MKRLLLCGTAVLALALVQPSRAADPLAGKAMLPNASNAVLPDARLNLGLDAPVATNTDLASTSTKNRSVVWRNDYAAGHGAPPLAFEAQSGLCAANGMRNDGGNCVNTIGGNSWKAQQSATGMDLRQFGAKCDVQYFSNDGSITAGSNVFHSGQYTFSASDVSTPANPKYIVIAGAGPGGAPLATTISGHSGADAVLADNASTSIPLYQATGALSVAPGTGFVPGDTVTVPGAVLQVTSTQVISATIVSGGSGGTDGTVSFDATTGTGPRKLGFTGVISGGALTSITSIFQPGYYSVNPTNLANEPVQVRSPGGNLTGAVVSVQMGARAAKVQSFTPGSTNPAGNAVAQTSSSGSGTGSTWTILSTGVPTWYFSSDDNDAFQAAGLAAQGGAVVRVPKGGCGTTKTIELPVTSGKGGALLAGEGRANTTIYALAPMPYVVHRGTTFAFGGGLRDLTIDAFKLADYGVYVDGGTQASFSPITVKNAKVAEVRNGNSYANNFDFLWAWTEPSIFRPDQRPQFNFYNQGGTDLHVYKLLTNNATEANIKDIGGSNSYISPHTYGYPDSNFAQYGIEAAGQIMIVNHEQDGATIAGEYFGGQSFRSTNQICQFFGNANVAGTAACVMLGTNAKYGSVTGVQYNTTYPIPPAAIIKTETGSAPDLTVQLWNNGEATVATDPAIPTTITASDPASGNSVRLSPSGRALSYLGPGTTMSVYGAGASTLSVSNDNGVLAKIAGGAGPIANRIVQNPAIAGGAPSFTTEGSDTDVGLILAPKGAGGTRLTSFLQLPNQSAPVIAANTIRLFSDTSNRLAWKGVNARVASLDATGLTGDHNYTLPNYDAALASLAGTETLTNKTITTPKITLPTSCTGLASGTLYNNAGTPAICP